MGKATCECCGKQMSIGMFAKTYYRVYEMNGLIHNCCAECCNQAVKAGKVLKYDEVNKKIIFVAPGDEVIRKKCECGYVFCYTGKDVAQNREQAKKALSASVTAIFTAGSNTSATSLNRADHALNQIVDYNKCPQCGSPYLTIISKEEYEQEQQKKSGQNTNVSPSPADELKKFKELLDSGIITQEEFDTKKKQLLGL